jgi:hypothetical protein
MLNNCHHKQAVKYCGLRYANILRDIGDHKNIGKEETGRANRDGNSREKYMRKVIFQHINDWIIGKFTFGF